MQSENINELAKALAAAQSEIKNPTKSKTAKAGSYSYKYADIADVLDCVLPALSKNGIAVSQPTVLEGEVLIVQTKLAHSSGQWMVSDYPVCRINGDHQKMGAALTYSRRYALCSMVGVAAEEDTDGENAEKAEAPKRKSSAQAKKDGDWEAMQNDLRDCGSAVRVQRLWDDYKKNTYPKWNQDWRREADELFAHTIAKFSTGDDLAQTMTDSLDATEAPQTRADYIRLCHETIENIAIADLMPWWNSEAAARRRFSLKQTEVDDLKQRVQERRLRPIKDTTGRELHPVEAG